MTATEAERNRRRGLTPWWRVRSWSKDLDTLIRLHKSLRALDGDPDAEQAALAAPALLPAPTELLARRRTVQTPRWPAGLAVVLDRVHAA